MTAGTENAHLPIQLRTEALEQLLVEAGLVDPAVMDKFISTYETDVGPMNGAKVVAKAWTDPGVSRALALRRHGRDRRTRLPRSAG